MVETRIENLRQQLEKHQIDLVAVNAGQTMIYLSGLHFHLSERPTVLLIGKDKPPALIFPEFERGKVDQANLELTPFPYPENPALWEEVFTKALNYCGKHELTIGLEPTAMRFLEIELMRAASKKAKFVSAGSILEQLRIVKDTREIDYLKDAVAIAQIALEKTIPMIKVGKTEKEITNELVINLFKSGSDPDLPFSPIVASGPNSANPHSIPQDRALKQGDFIVIDWGARMEGYISDITRTFGLGRVDEKMRTVYTAVKQANKAARSAQSTNLIAEEIDRAARDVIGLSGYGEFFNHRTGHGIGLEAHEEPFIAPANRTKIREGMTFTIEPGIYFAGKFGVRIEDDMLASKNGLVTLTSLGRELTIL